MSNPEYSEFLYQEDAPQLPPDRQKIAHVTEQVRSFLFPQKPVGKKDFEQNVFALKNTVREILLTVLPHEKVAEECASVLLASLATIQKQCHADVQAALNGDPAAANPQEVIAYYPGFFATLTYRIAHKLHEYGVPSIPRGMTEYAHSKTGIDIHPGAVIGEEFFIDHGTGVVIGETVNIGSRVKMYQGVTLGDLSFRKDEHGKVIREEKRHPTLEDNVTVYANATVLGGKTIIGHDSVIGSSVWLTNSVKPYSKVGMEPPQIIVKSSATTR